MGKRLLYFILLLVLPLSVAAQTFEIKSARTWSAPDNSRVVFDVDGPVKHRLFVLHHPERIVVDLFNTRLEKAIDFLNIKNSLISSVRSGSRGKGDLRIVFDVKRLVQPRSFVLKPNEKYGYRLVIDLLESGKTKPRTTLQTEPDDKLRDVIVAIDAGHGGEDPGAMGREGLQEKDLVLSIAQRLKTLIEQQPGMRPLMIRKGDYFISLNERKKIAQHNKADMFISIHADSFKNKRARGASVFAVSAKGASSEAARLLAENENATDVIGGVSLEDKDDLLTSVLLDLSQAGTIEASLDLGSKVLNEIEKIGAVHKPHVEQAGFVVLKSLGIPSILVETGFISNRREERKLRDWRYQSDLAGAILDGIKDYFVHHAPPGTLLAAKHHKYIIQPGDTLSAIAQQHNVSLQVLKNTNDLSDDLLNVGQVIRIP